VKELLKQHLGSIAIAVAIFLAVVIHAVTTRYIVVKTKSLSGRDDTHIFDRWTGREK